MLTCREVPDIASDYISREGSRRTRVMVAYHLTRCRNCRAYIRSLKTVRSLAAESLAGPAPPALLQTLGLDTRDPSGSLKEPKE